MIKIIFILIKMEIGVNNIFVRQGLLGNIPWYYYYNDNDVPGVTRQSYFVRAYNLWNSLNKVF
jgi:hypothetical protein